MRQNPVYVLCVIATAWVSASAVAVKRGLGAQKEQQETSALFSEEVNPIRKVVGMLTDMRGELERERDQEAELFEKAMCACENGEKDLNKVIEESSAEITRLSTKIEEESAQKAQVDQALKEHYGNKEGAEGDLAKATAIRDKESKRFSQESRNGKYNVDSLSKAIPKLEMGASSASLMQQDEDFPKLRRVIEVTHFLSPDNREKVLAFLDDGLGDGGAAAGPTAPVAEIVGVLKSMKDSMAKDLAETTATEQAAARDYATLKAAKQEEISVATDAIISKEKRAGTLAVSLTTSKDALDDAKEELSDSQSYLKTLTADCTQKREMRDTRKQMRADEITAISEAITILTSDDSLDVFKKAVPSASLLAAKRKTFDALLQMKKAPSKNQKKSLLQFSEAEEEEGMLARQHPGLFRARTVISRLEQKHPSQRLSLLLTALNGEVRANGREDPDSETEKYAGGAAKVVSGMIDSMVHVLHDEDVEDEHKKEWCANETEKTNNLKSEKQDLTDQLSSSIEQMGDDLIQFADDIKTIEGEINANDQEVHAATELRKKEHQEFVDTFSTLDTARRLIEKAANRLHKFYNPQAMKKKIDKIGNDAVKKAGLHFDDSFIQARSVGKRGSRKVAPPVTVDTPKTYEKQESGGVIGLMAKMKEELAADMAESETEEKNSAKDYARIMKEAQETRALDVKRLTQKKAAKAALEEKKLQAQDLRSTTLKELQNLQIYIVQLGSECDFLMRNFEVRHDGRVSEEVGLEDAKTIVTDEEPPTHTEIEAGFDSEHGEADVEQHFPEEGGHIHVPVPVPGEE